MFYCSLPKKISAIISCSKHVTKVFKVTKFNNVNMINIARCMAKTTGVDYAAVLESLVAWGIEDDSDDIATNVLSNVTHGATS